MGPVDLEGNQHQEKREKARGVLGDHEEFTGVFFSTSLY